MYSKIWHSIFSMLIFFIAIISHGTEMHRCGYILGSGHEIVTFDKTEVETILSGNPAQIKIGLLKLRASKVIDFSIFAYSFYGSRGSRVVDSLKLLGENFEELIVDPGIVLHFEKFKKFVKSNGIEASEPWSVRQKFSNFLGSRKVYRAMALSEVDANAIVKTGIYPPLLQDVKMAYDHFSSRLSDFYTPEGRTEMLEVGNNKEKQSMMNLIWQKVDRGGDVFTGSILSVSEDMNIATSVAHTFLRPTKKVYLFELKIPELDIIYSSPKLGIDVGYWGILVKQLLSKVEVGDAKGNFYSMSHGRSVESFIYYVIPSNQIVSVRQVPDNEVGFIAFKNRGSNKYNACFGNCSSKTTDTISKDQ